jgi:hypothetical protein
MDILAKENLALVVGPGGEKDVRVLEEGGEEELSKHGI